MSDKARLISVVYVDSMSKFCHSRSGMPARSSASLRVYMHEPMTMSAPSALATSAG